MRTHPWSKRLWAAVLGVLVAAQLVASPDVARKTKAECVACHNNPAGGAELSEAGKAWKPGARAPATAAKTASYVGSARCMSCHIKQHRAWTETVHARALTNLQAADASAVADMAAKLKIKVAGSPVTTDDCVKCHVTGFQLAGGYPGADSAGGAATAAVGCESCHGPGSQHITARLAEKKKVIHRGSSAGTCKQCHTPVTSPEFKFEEWVKRGAHPIPVEK